MKHKKNPDKILDTYEHMIAHAESMPDNFFVTASGICEPLSFNSDHVQDMLENNKY